MNQKRETPTKTRRRPFAFLVGITLHWRPRLMPYKAVVHTLMDMAFAVIFLSAAD